MTTHENAVLDAWRVNASVTTLLVDALPAVIWDAGIPGSPRRTVRSLAAHLHNTRCMWMRSLAAGTTATIPSRVDPRAVTKRDLLASLKASGNAILLMLEAAQRNGGTFPGVSGAFIWGAIPGNTALFVGYALSHEAHHRGQLVLIARALGHRLPARAVTALWQWSSRLRESRPRPADKRHRRSPGQVVAGKK